MSEVPWYDAPTTGEAARVELLRARVVLAHRQGEHERRSAALAALGPMSFADAADWLFDQRSPEERQAWFRKWRALGLHEVEPARERFERGALAAVKPKRAYRRRRPPVIPPARQMEIALAALARQEVGDVEAAS